jgi:hypothetical protein
MEQPQIRVKLPLGTKLIFITVLLLLATIGFLATSSVLLLAKDKLAYTYEAQSTQASLIGRSIRGEVSQAIDALRLSLASQGGGDRRRARFLHERAIDRLRNSRSLRRCF